ELQNHLLRRVAVVPEVGAAHLIFDVDDVLTFGSVVKESLRVGPGGRESRRLVASVLHPSVRYSIVIGGMKSGLNQVNAGAANSTRERVFAGSERIAAASRLRFA